MTTELASMSMSARRVIMNAAMCARTPTAAISAAVRVESFCRLTEEAASISIHVRMTTAAVVKFVSRVTTTPFVHVGTALRLM